MRNDVLLDDDRRERIGIDEAVFSQTKSDDQLLAIARQAAASGSGRLFTRLAAGQFAAIDAQLAGAMDYDPVSRTGIIGPVMPRRNGGRVAIVTAGSSDLPVAREAARTLLYHGQAATELHDVGVAGLWRLMSRLGELSGANGLIVVAGMEGALPTVLGGLLPLPIVAVPTSVGYGVSGGGRVALESALASCAPGLTVVNIDNGYGAACAMLRILPAVTAAATARARPHG
ncbi:nickel pincer cofactor biosynthesis protein LarB [Ramlibacter sp.]|uniref:nickel pincer cofactor biosynthesis protein LarB n=1 Tax=Ramlibacter sp. TaxID=1917967 RepID=UPI002FCB251B